MIHEQTSLWKPSEDGKVCVPAEQNISKRHLHLLSALLDNMFWSSRWATAPRPDEQKHGNQWSGWWIMTGRDAGNRFFWIKLSQLQKWVPANPPRKLLRHKKLYFWTRRWSSGVCNRSWKGILKTFVFNPVRIQSESGRFIQDIWKRRCENLHTGSSVEVFSASTEIGQLTPFRICFCWVGVQLKCRLGESEREMFKKEKHFKLKDVATKPSLTLKQYLWCKNALICIKINTYVCFLDVSAKQNSPKSLNLTSAWEYNRFTCRVAPQRATQNYLWAITATFIVHPHIHNNAWVPAYLPADQHRGGGVRCNGQDRRGFVWSWRG